MGLHDWVVVQLSPRGEDEDPDTLVAAVKRLIKADVFVPASVSKVGETRVVHRLVDGYIFVRRTEADAAYFRLEQTRYIESILTTRAVERGRMVRRIATVPNDNVEKMRRQIHVETEQGIQVGDEVQVTSGVYRGINARVIEEIPENDSVQVHIKLRSKEAIVTLPRSFLKFVSKGDGAVPSFSPFVTTIARIRDWVKQVSPIITWTPPILTPITEGLAKVQRIATWAKDEERLWRLWWLSEWAPGMAPIQKALDKFKTLHRWQPLASLTFIQAKLGHTDWPSIDPVQSKLVEVGWLHDAVRRLAALTQDIEGIERSLTARSPDMIQNLIIDGHNMAYRVFHALNAPGVKPMSDSKGRPTSIIFGVLKSLGSLQKRFPEAQIYVCWDGSPARRKALYPEYKANRPERSLDGATPTFNQIEYLRKLLPALGVAQAFNPEEETDDIIGCLVRGKLQGQNNIIVSNDHDFMQLVTRTDILMIPKIGNRPETLYDPDRVMADYGVEPSKVVQLRALMGSADASDNLKGVPRVPTKVLASLVNAYGSVDGIYASGMAGVTPNQFEKIRAAEKQVRLNVQLMTLQCDLEYANFEAKPDPEEAVRLLEAVDIQAEPITKAFFREMKGFEKTSDGSGRRDEKTS